MKIIVIGAGILGASIACRMALAGADVSVLDSGSSPASGVTSLAFGWVNLIYSNPEHGACHALRSAAFAEWQRLPQEFPDAFGAARRGSLIWKETGEDTEQLVTRHARAGTQVELIDRARIAALEPDLRELPEVAAYLPVDFALSPAVFAAFLLRKAAEHGAAVRYGCAVLSLETRGYAVTGVRTAEGVIAADRVIVAGGAGTGRLVGPLVPDLGLTTSPTILFTFAAQRQAIRHIVCGPDLEVRQSLDGQLYAAEGYVDETPEHGPAALRVRMQAAIERHFPALGVLTPLSMGVGYRTMFHDGMPRVGLVPGVKSLYLAVGHPGVILGPLIGRLVTEELMSGRRSPLLG
jgi:glycine/D-amino acid oxidase-like deaminating enzyme